MSNFTNEQLEAASAAKSPDELIETHIPETSLNKRRNQWIAALT